MSAPSLLTEKEGVEGMLLAVKFGLSLLEAPSLKEVVSEVVVPSPDIKTDDELIRDTASTIYHSAYYEW